MNIFSTISEGRKLNTLKLKYTYNNRYMPYAILFRHRWGCCSEPRISKDNTTRDIW